MEKKKKPSIRKSGKENENAKEYGDDEKFLHDLGQKPQESNTE